MYLILFLSFCLYNHGFVLKQQTRFHAKLTMNQFDNAKEYYEFYTKYKQPILSNHNHLVNYEEFAQRHNTSYSIFRKNLMLIQETNEILKNDPSKLVLGENQFMDIVDFDDETCKNSMLTTIIPPPKTQTSYSKLMKKPFRYLQNMFHNGLSRFSWNDTGLLSPV